MCTNVERYPRCMVEYKVAKYHIRIDMYICIYKCKEIFIQKLTVSCEWYDFE